MNTPEWLKPGLYGAVIGAVVVGVSGFTLGGWVTGGTAQDRAMEMSREDVASAMAPVCVDIARADPDRAEKIAVIRDTSRFQRRDALMDTGWATVPGADAPDRDIALACLALLDVDAVPEPPNAATDEG